MPALLRAADVLVENAGGLTALEAMACGLPVATYRPIPGHGRANAGTMARAGVTTWVRRSADLGPTLVRLADGTEGQRQRAAGLALFDADPAGVVADVARGVEAAPSGRTSATIPGDSAPPLVAGVEPPTVGAVEPPLVGGAGPPLVGGVAPPVVGGVGPVPAEVVAGPPGVPPRRTLTRWVGLRASVARLRIGADEPRSDGGPRPANRPDGQG
jgi:hypothetical protein